MRGYLPTSAQEISDFSKVHSLTVESIYGPTIKFLTDNNDLNEEEVEFTLSMMAAQESLDMRDAEDGFGFVLALEIPEEVVDQHYEDSFSLKAALLWDFVACLFLVSHDGEELTWFATQEIVPNLDVWIAKV